MKIRPDLQVILCTGYSDPFSRQIAERLGDRIALHQPLRINEPARAIRDVFDNAST